MRIDKILWNDWSIEHIGQHGVRSEEVEEVFRKHPSVRKARKDRYMAQGITDTGRYLFIIFEYLGQNRTRIITARDMTEKEKKLLKGK